MQMCILLLVYFGVIYIYTTVWALEGPFYILLSSSKTAFGGGRGSKRWEQGTSV